jgi:hypothetical protein
VDSSTATSAKHTKSRSSVVGAMDAEAVSLVTAALTKAGFAKDRIQVVTAADVEGMESPLERSGIRGLVGRFLLNLGDDLDEMELMRQELKAGHVLVFVPVEGDKERERVRAIFRDHGGHSIKHYGHWTITPLE